MKRRVAIIGTGQTAHRSKRPDVSIPELVREAVDRALANAQVEPQAVIIGNMEPFEGIHLSDQWSVTGAGGIGKPGLKVATGGTTGSSLALAGTYAIASGLWDVVMVVGWEKLSESGGETTTGIITAFDPIYERPTFAGAVSGLAVYAQRYVHQYGVTPEQAALVAVKARQNAMRNPYAHLRKPVTMEEVLNSPMLSTPIRYLDMCPTSDGACAVIFASEKFAGQNPAWVRAVTSGRNHPYLGDVTLGADTYLDTLATAAQQAYRKAGITPKDVDVVEMYDPCTYLHLCWLESLGFCEPGQAGRFVEKTSLPINPSGGVLCTNPIGATGLIRVAEAAMQLRGEAGERQVDGARTAVVTGFGGSFWNEVMVLCNRS